MHDQDWMFDVIMDVCNHAYANGFHRTSLHLEKSLDAYLQDRGALIEKLPPEIPVCSDANAVFRSVRSPGQTQPQHDPQDALRQFLRAMAQRNGYGADPADRAA